MIKEVIATGKNVEAAIDAGCEQLGIEREDIEFEIIDMPRKGFLGLTSIPAKVRVFIELPDPAPAKAEAEPAPAPRPAARAEIPSETKVAIIKALSGVLPRSVYTYLTLAKMYRDGNTLTLGTEGELSASLLDKADVRTAVAGAASKILNETVTVRVASAEKEKRRASAFDGFDQIMQEGQDAGLPIELK